MHTYIRTYRDIVNIEKDIYLYRERAREKISRKKRQRDLWLLS